MKRLLLIVLPLLLIVGCSKPLDDDTLLDRNGIKYEQNKQEPYNGRVFSLHPSGKKKLDGNYKNGKKIGVWTIFYDNDKNNKFKENIYENGKLSGLVEWYDNGHKKYEGSIDKYGKKLGHWIKWYENGEKFSQANYINERLDSTYIEWYENGQKRLETNYLNGMLDGPYSEWYINGQKKTEKVYKNNGVSGGGDWIEWYDNGQKSLEIEKGYLNYEEGGSYIEWHKSGEKRMERIIENGEGKDIYRSKNQKSIF